LQNVCGNCHKEIGDVTFCPFCGLPQQCTNCGGKFESDERFCGYCGTKRENLAEQQKNASEQADGQNDEERTSDKETEHTSTPNSTHEEETTESEVHKPSAQVASTTSKTTSTVSKTTESTQTNQSKTSPSFFKKPPFIIGAIVVIGIIIAIFSGTFADDEKKIEKTIHAYLSALEEFDFNKMQEMHHPETPHIEDINDFIEIPFDIEIEVHRIYNIDIDEEDDYAEATVLISVHAPSFDEDHYGEELYFEFKNFKDQWYIYDVY